MSIKLTSYQKLKLEISKLKADKKYLEDMIADDNKIAMNRVKVVVNLKRDISNSVWMGDRSRGDGILSQIKRWNNKG